MILLLGGTSETAQIANSLAPLEILASTATNVELDVGNQANVRRRHGRLDHESMTRIIKENDIKIIVDAVHPYAYQAKITAYEVAKQMRLPHFTFIRPPAIKQEEILKFAENHDNAAEIAFSSGKAVLATTGSNNIEAYAKQSKKTGIPFVARVLPDAASVKKCVQAGIPHDMVVTHRGASSIEENRALIKKFNIGVVVTKDSGLAGGTVEKLEAARLEKCELVVVKRPDYRHMKAFYSVSELVEAVKTIGSIN